MDGWENVATKEDFRRACTHIVNWMIFVLLAVTVGGIIVIYLAFP